MSGSARGVRSNAHSYRNWGEGLGNDPSYPAPEDSRALRIECAVSDQVVDGSARLEVRIELDERGRPEVARVIGRIDLAGDVLGADPGKAPGEPLVLGDEFLPEGEDIHQQLPAAAAWARASIAAHRSIRASNDLMSSSSMPSASIRA